MSSSTSATPPLSSIVVQRSAYQSTYSPIYMAATLAASDFMMLAAALGAGFELWRLINPAIPSVQREILLLPVCCVGMFGFTGQYPGIGLTAVEHLRRICRSISSVYLLFLAAMFLTKESWANSRGAMLLAWAFSLAMVSGGRSLTMYLMARRRWWGVPVLVIGAGHTGRATVRNLQANRILGYRPMAFLDDDPRKQGNYHGVPVAGTLDDALTVSQDFGVGYAILAIPRMPRERLASYLPRWRRIFPKILIISELVGMLTHWTEPRDLGGITGFETHQKLLEPTAQWIKRMIDIAAGLGGLILSAPLVIACALWIRKSSPGNPFYVQERQGRDGATLRMLKLRTMFPNADEMIESYLARDTSAREEWEHFCKLKHDPRILPGVGHFLRKTSLDELPQLWNVVKGEMSLVGPRPFPAYHNSRFDPEFLQVRMQVRPGLTGLWQVSARSNGDLSVQQTLDSYYIRNWSLWLDIYILFRTVRAVLIPSGSC
jgi:Undecaprenyl-phosphate galactose phosphotransferase WbaP